jgi:hypothetical protein
MNWNPYLAIHTRILYFLNFARTIDQIVEPVVNVTISMAV